MPNQPQSFQHHAKLDPLFHFCLIPIFLFNILGAIHRCWVYPNAATAWNIVLALAILLLTFKTRVYALKVQDRLIRLEERLRLAGLPPTEPALATLTERQYIALRFASDPELLPLARRAATENLSSKEIKASITSWRADHFRI